MKILYSVLRSYLPTLRLNPLQVGDLYTMKSYEVEGVTELGHALEHVVVGQIRTIIKHPNADKLRCTTVDIGQETLLSIVCGASNIEVGQKVPVACIGAVLPGDFKIQKTKIRGEVSEGMLCSGRELGLGDDHQGIFILDSEFPLGVPVSQILHLDDAIIEIDNKGLGTRAADSSSFMGLARELAILQDMKWDVSSRDQLTRITKSSWQIQREESVCQSYAILELDGVFRYADELFWSADLTQVIGAYNLNHIRKILSLLGKDPQNASVDLSNYLMEEIGQPIHMFDPDKLTGSTIHIRKARAGERVILLNDQEVNLETGDIVICDEEKIIALAGIMGAKNSCVDEHTKRLLIEVANFDANQIRITARRLKVLSDAAKRFERGVPTQLVAQVINRIIDFADAEQVPIGGYTRSGQEDQRSSQVRLTYEYVRRYLGCDVSDQEIRTILERLNIEIHDKSRDEILLQSPYWRLDLNTPEEYIEEIARIYGYDSIPPRLDLDWQEPHHDPIYLLHRSSAEALRSLGYTEVMTYSYTGDTSQYRMINPVDERRPYLRERLTPSLEMAREKNVREFPKHRMFEITQVFGSSPELHLAMTLAHPDQSLDEICNQLYQDFGKLLMVLRIDLSHLDFHPESDTITLKYGNENLGSIDINRQILEISLHTLLRVASWIPDKFQEVPKYPVVKRDITLEVRKNDAIKDLYDRIQKATSNRLETIALIDRFSKDGKVKYTFHLEFRDLEKSLSDKDILSEMQKISREFNQEV